LHQELTKAEVHRRLGGISFRGITGLTDSPNVLVFATTAGAQFGYHYEGWKADGTYHYTGEGQVGDQELTQGNAGILNHQDAGRALRLFEEVGRTRTGGKIVRYLGEFAVDEHDPYYRADAPDREGTMRSVMVFRLRPVDPSIRPATPEREPAVRDIPIEAHKTETFAQRPNEGLTLAERREAALVQRYTSWLEARGNIACRKAILIPGTAVCLYTDLYDQTAKELIEAKGTASRLDVRHALGQLLDYARFVDHARLAALLPVHPGADLAGLLADHGVDVIYETKSGHFARGSAQHT
jgi:hypothetical protein